MVHGRVTTLPLGKVPGIDRPLYCHLRLSGLTVSRIPTSTYLCHEVENLSSKVTTRVWYRPK